MIEETLVEVPVLTTRWGLQKEWRRQERRSCVVGAGVDGLASRAPAALVLQKDHCVEGS